jgi:PTH1 family peptidyl-tRNA hydrolase
METKDPADSDIQWTFWQSPSHMNTSGPAVNKAWNAFQKDLSPEERRDAVLVVVHDELELPLGKVKVKTGGTHRGHNGLRSCHEAIGKDKYTRLAIGIDRPESRDPQDVANYVLRKIGRQEKEVLEGKAGWDTVKALQEIGKKM